MQGDSALDLETLKDGCIKVCLTEDGITQCCTVSSHHLVEEKRRQLKQAIVKEAIKSFEH
jgi:hypothetical protein